MPKFNADTEEIIAFDFENTYLFTVYFDEKQLFNQLKKYYNNHKYRFKVPDKDLEEVQQTLDNYLYRLVVEDPLEEYCVVVDKETDTSAIVRNTVMSKQRRSHDIHLMKNKLSLKKQLNKTQFGLKNRSQHGECRMENQRIIAGPIVKKPVGTSRYKYLPNSNLTKRISS